WLQPHLAQPLPGPPCRHTGTMPATLHPCRRSPQRLAYHALVTASAEALTRLATDERCSGTALPGCTGVLHPWGRQLQDHPHLHSIVPGGGLSTDRTPWRPSNAPVFVPVSALAPLDRAMGKA